MKYYFFCLAILLTGFIRAQNITPSVINTGGSQAAVGNIQFEFSLGESFVSTIGNTSIVTQGLLQPITASHISLPVTGLQFAGRRIDKDKVQLEWRTLQEMNNLGFQVERKKDIEVDFTPVEFVVSKSVDGNSTLPLQYLTIDNNNFTGISYYRLKQIDIDGNFTYSTVCRIEGLAREGILMKVWPVPSNGDFTVLVSGIDQDVLQVFDISGRLIRQMPVINDRQEKITGLRPGTYIMRLAKAQTVVQKVLVQ